MDFLRFFINLLDKIYFWRKVFVSSLAYILYYGYYYTYSMQRQYVLLYSSRTIQGTETHLHLRNLLEGTMHHKTIMEIHKEVMEDHHQLFQSMMEDMANQMLNHLSKK